MKWSVVNWFCAIGILIASAAHIAEYSSEKATHFEWAVTGLLCAIYFMVFAIYTQGTERDD